MKNDWLITFRSVTFAQKGERLLQRAGIGCRLLRTPRSLSERGCGYCLQLGKREAVAGVAILQKNGIRYEKVYAPGERGELEERVL